MKRENLLDYNLQFFAEGVNDDDDNVDDENVEDQNNQGGTGDKGDDGDKGGSDNKGKTEKTFTQSQVNRMMAKEKKQGRNAVYNELGINPGDSKMVNMFKAFIESQKTEEEKANEQAAKERAELQSANERALKAEAKAEAMLLGVKPQYVEDIVTLAMVKMSGDENAELKTLISEYKTKYPMWFGESEDDKDNKDDKQKTGQKGTGSSVKASGKDKENKGTESLGARLAAQRKGVAKKTSYWGK